MRITKEYFIKVIDSTVGRTISEILNDSSLTTLQKIVKLENYSDCEFEVRPSDYETPEPTDGKIKIVFFLEDSEYPTLFQFAYVTEDIDIRLTLGHDKYSYLYDGSQSRYYSKQEIDEIEDDLSYHLLESNNHFDINKEELGRILKVKSTCV